MGQDGEKEKEKKNAHTSTIPYFIGHRVGDIYFWITSGEKLLTQKTLSSDSSVKVALIFISGEQPGPGEKPQGSPYLRSFLCDIQSV